MYKLALLLFVGAAAAQQFSCPVDDGFYVDPNQCDKYYDCYRGKMTVKLCPDGLVFDYTLSPRVEQCNYPFLIDCAEGSLLQEPQPSGIECPRMNGYFEHEDPANCREYYECTSGIAVLRSCHKGLVFDEFSGTCQWAHTGIRQGCNAAPQVKQGAVRCDSNITQLADNGHEFANTRFPDPEDCRMFYVCDPDEKATQYGCPPGLVFNDVSLQCDSPEFVPGCENYYADEPPLTGISAAGLDRAQG